MIASFLYFIVFGFLTREFVGNERGEHYSVLVGFSPGHSHHEKLEFDVNLNFGTARE